MKAKRTRPARHKGYEYVKCGAQDIRKLTAAEVAAFREHVQRVMARALQVDAYRLPVDA